MFSKNKDEILAVTMPAADAEILWEGETLPKDTLIAIERTIRDISINEVKEGETVIFPNGKSLEVKKGVIDDEKKLIWLTLGGKKMPAPFWIIKDKGVWKVDASPFISSKKLMPKKIQYTTSDKSWPPQNTNGGEWVIALPPDWRKISSANIVERLRIDGTDKILPFFDGSQQPLRMGIFIEELLKGSTTIDKELDKYSKEINSGKFFSLRGKITIKDVVSDGGIKGKSISYVVDETKTGRLFFYDKFLFLSTSGKPVIITSYIAGGKPSEQFINKSGILKLIRAYILSVALKEDDINIVPIARNLAEIDEKLPDAISLGQKATDLINKNDIEAIKLFNESIKLCDYIPFVHNNLASIYEESLNKELLDYKKALEHAKKAVDLTDELDPANLDTLAIAYFKNNQKDKAVETIKKAIKLAPGKNRYKELLASFGKNEKNPGTE